MSGRAALLRQPGLPAPPDSDFVQLRAVRALQLAEVTDAQRQSPLAVPSLPHACHRWPCHLALAPCPDGPRTPCQPHRGLPGAAEVPRCRTQR